MKLLNFSSILLGKYKEIVVAIALFILFDLGVLVLNFYTSFKFAEDAIGINLAGRQRMLSQRMTKSLLSYQLALKEGISDDTALQELTLTTALFNSTLHAFDKTGEVMGTDGNKVLLKQVQDETAKQYLQESLALWDSVYQSLQLIVRKDNNSIPFVDNITQQLLNTNLIQLKLMNLLTTRLQELATQRANFLRMVQTTGITLVIINFFFILFHFIARLHRGDKELESARKETTEILETVNEGLFLLDDKFNLGSQYSTILPEILGTNLAAQQSFLSILKNMVPESVLQEAKDYLELLFTDHVKEKLIMQLNPLETVEVNISHFEKDQYQYKTKYLSFIFNRILENNKIQHLLVTVTDITDKVVLAQELEKSTQRAQDEMSMLLALLKMNPVALGIFMREIQNKLSKINELLKNATTRQFKTAVQEIFTLVHSIKGEAAALGFENFAKRAHTMEIDLVKLREKNNIEGTDFIQITIFLNDFLKDIDIIKELMEKISNLQLMVKQDVATETTINIESQLKALAKRVAEDEGKKVQLSCKFDHFNKLSNEQQILVKDVLIQLVRNSIVHGIEMDKTRQIFKKPLQGHIAIQLLINDKNQVYLHFKDDGQGLSLDKIKEKLISSGCYSEADLCCLNNKQIMMKIFESGFSTKNNANEHAGHGVGMDVVASAIKELNAKIALDTKENKFFEFKMQFPLNNK